ncbi:MAG TPA: response regulator [Tepidisphaeraceae bacterium]|nr:response regulator [Tepidisphaeraceae bacterium]
MAQSLEILMVDDNPADVRLAQEAFREGKIFNTLSVAKDGVEAMAYLRRLGSFAAAARPDLIFLDLNLPRKDGREVLAEIKSDPDLCRIPVVILTTSSAERDIIKSYDLHANCYIVKPVDLDKFIEVIRTIEHFWLSSVTLPPR